MSEQAIAILYLVVSSIALATQSWSLYKIYRLSRGESSDEQMLYWQVVRTASCRVMASFVYVGVGVTAVVEQSSMTLFSLSVFSSIQCVWLVNGLMDVTVRRKLRKGNK